MQITFSQTRKLDPQFVKDVMTTAVEGGVNYWFRFLKIERDSELNVTRVVGEDVEDESVVFSCDLTKLCEGMERITNSDRYPENKDMHMELCQCIIEQDSCNIDAEGADIIMQLAIFESVVYG